MKKYILSSFCALVIFTSTFSQSKAETEQWLQSKFSKYNLKKGGLLFKEDGFTTYGSVSIDNYSFRFEDPFFVFSFRERRSVSQGYGTQDKLTTYNYEYKIPLAFFQDIIVTNPNAKVLKQGIGYINAIEYQIVVTKEGAMQVTSDGIREPYTPLVIDLLISSEDEDNLAPRLRKAFLHLKTLYSKPKAKPKGEGELF